MCDKCSLLTPDMCVSCNKRDLQNLKRRGSKYTDRVYAIFCLQLGLWLTLGNATLIVYLGAVSALVASSSAITYKLSGILTRFQGQGPSFQERGLEIGL